MYSIQLTPNQARVVRDALDLYSRICMGQLGEIKFHASTKDHLRMGQEIEDLIDRLTAAMFPELPSGAYHGIRSPEISEDARVAYDIQQAIRYQIAWDSVGLGDESPMVRDMERTRRKGLIQVDFDRPMRTAENEPMPKMVNVT